MGSGSFKNVIFKMCLKIIYLIHMHKKDLALNYQQWLICHTKIKQCSIFLKYFISHLPFFPLSSSILYTILFFAHLLIHLKNQLIFPLTFSFFLYIIF